MIAGLASSLVYGCSLKLISSVTKRPNMVKPFILTSFGKILMELCEYREHSDTSCFHLSQCRSQKRNQFGEFPRIRGTLVLSRDAGSCVAVRVTRLIQMWPLHTDRMQWCNPAVCHFGFALVLDTIKKHHMLMRNNCKL